jgi:zinc/manganese transport system permease protein
MEDAHGHIAAQLTNEQLRRALLGCLMLAASACPVGVFLMLRRMSLAGDTLSHAILPGAAAAFLLYGMDIIPMTIGGLLAGLFIALASGALSRLTVLREDATLAVFYTLSLSAGILMLGSHGSDEELLHFLFGDVSSLTDGGLRLIAVTAAITLATLGLFWRALVADCLDPLYLRSVSRWGAPAHLVFLALVVLNLIASLQAMGALLSVGLMMLPAAAARFWTARIGTMAGLASAIGMASCVAGLLAAWRWGVVAAPAIIFAAGGVFLVSVLFGPRGLAAGRAQNRHRAL